MRYSIFDFNQEECMKLELSMNDLLLLDYIQKAIASPTMKHAYTGNEVPCVWLCHKKILEDLPILNIGNDRLKRYLTKYVELGLLIRTTQNKGVNGTRTYYGITEKFESLQKAGVENNTSSSKARVKNNTPDKGIRNKDKEDTIFNKIKNSSETVAKPKKQNLYEKCVDVVKEFNFTEELEELVCEYLSVRLKITDKPIYNTNQWKAILRKLNTLAPDDVEMQKQIVQQSIERGYASVFPVSSYNQTKTQKTKSHNKGVSCEQYTAEEEAEIRKWQREVVKNGGRIKY